MQYTLINEVKVMPDPIPVTPVPTRDVCAGGFVVKKQKFLFGKRSKSKDWAPGLWDIVGGRSLKNEHPMFTLQRETFEETGARVLNAQLITTGDVVSRHAGQPLFRYHIYIITHFKGKIYNKSSEHTKLKWFTRAELDKLPLALGEYLTMIDDWIAGNAKS